MATNAQSVVDFMKSRGFNSQGERFPLYETRKKIYDTLGLGGQLGDFRGDANQNTALLNKLSASEKNVGVSINPENVFDIVRNGGKIPQSGGTGGIAVPIGQSAEESAKQIGLPSAPTGEVAGAPVFGAQSEAPKAPVLPDATGLTKTYSPNELLALAGEKVAGSAEFPIKREEFETEKAGLQLQAQADKEKFIKDIASRGLIFSGKKATGVNAIEAETLAKQLGVDRKYALFIATGLQTAAKEIASEAQKGNEMALTSLRSLGYDINPLTGQVEPTLAAKKAEETQERFVEQQEATQARFEAQQDLRNAQFELNQARTLASMETAQQRLEIAQAQLDLAQKKSTEGSAVDLRNYKETLAGYLGVVPDYTSREEALNELSKYEAKMNVEIGKEGIDVVKKEIDRQFPEKTGGAEKKKQLFDINPVEEAGKFISNLFR